VVPIPRNFLSAANAAALLRLLEPEAFETLHRKDQQLADVPLLSFFVSLRTFLLATHGMCYLAMLSGPRLLSEF
jgi:hypothetical protein